VLLPLTEMLLLLLLLPLTEMLLLLLLPLTEMLLLLPLTEMLLLLLLLCPQAKPNISAARRGQQRYTSRCHVADVVQAVLADMQRRSMPASTGTPLPANTQQKPLPLSLQLQQQQQEGDEDFIWPGLQVGSRYVDVTNVVDDEPAPRGDVEQYALQLLAGSQAGRLPAQPAAAADSSSSSSSSAMQGQVSSSSTQEESSSKPRSSSSSSSRRAEPLEEKRVRNDKLKAPLGVQLLAPTYREGLALMHAGSIAPFAAEDLECLFASSNQ
jgi:hypothetical protein